MNNTEETTQRRLRSQEVVALGGGERSVRKYNILQIMQRTKPPDGDFKGIDTLI